MRPNSFDIYWTTDARGAVRRLKQEWDRFWTDDMQREADALGLTKGEVLTLASIVEWEARRPEERPRIAGVYLNRLLGRTRTGRMRLQADPTVQYALMRSDGGRMRRLLFEDYKFADPYNTYLIDGLPPGPINNPSESSDPRRPRRRGPRLPLLRGEGRRDAHVQPDAPRAQQRRERLPRPHARTPPRAGATELTPTVPPPTA